MSAGRTSILRRRAWAHFLLYAFDMAAAMTSFVFGFGLAVHNWWALLLVGLVGRWVFFIAGSALMHATQRERIEEDTASEALQ